MRPRHMCVEQACGLERAKRCNTKTDNTDSILEKSEVEYKKPVIQHSSIFGIDDCVLILRIG